MKRAKAWWVVVSVLGPWPLAAQSLADDPRVSNALQLLETWVDAQVAYGGIPGASMAVVRDQTTLWSRGFGYADRDRRTPATPETRYRICSISKLFTSIATMQLRDQGRLRLDDPVAKHLPWFTIRRQSPEARPATVEGLLTHISGLPREAADLAYWSGPDSPFPTRDQIRQGISSQEMLYPPGTWFQYSNLAITLAGEIVAEVSGQPYGDYVTKSILTPLGMDDTSPEVPELGPPSRLATGYSVRRRDGSRAVVPFRQTAALAPAAGFVSTVGDLGRFAAWQMRLLERGGAEVIDANTLREMQRVHAVDHDWATPWGLGFALWRGDGKSFVGHIGSCLGFESELSLQPEDKLAVIFMSNALNAETRLFVRQAHGIVGPAVAAALASPGAGPRPDPDLTRYLGRYDRAFGRELHVLRWEGSLALLPLPTANPLGELTKLRRVSEHTFKRVRQDGGLGEEVVFEVDRAGVVTRLRQHSNFAIRAR
jgi:CubicO group peptidase (beta-lactamase class C family)